MRWVTLHHQMYRTAPIDVVFLQCKNHTLTSNKQVHGLGYDYLTGACYLVTNTCAFNKAT